MVVMASPTTDPTCVMQERVARPLIRTVHAPQTPIPQPYLEPLRSRVSRKTQSSGVSGGTSTVVTTLLTFSFRGMPLPCLRADGFCSRRPVLDIVHMRRG